MSVKRSPCLWPEFLLLGFLVAAVVPAVVGCTGGVGLSKKNASSFSYQGTELSGPASDFKLVSHRGKQVALSDFRGKAVVLAFLDPECTDVCPLTANAFRLTAEALGKEAAAVVFLAVNVNPGRSSVADVAEATAKWGVQKLESWHFLTGTRDELQPVWQSYGILAEGPPKPDKPTELEHTPGVYLIDQAGNKRRYISTAFDPGISLSGLLVKQVRALRR